MNRPFDMVDFVLELALTDVEKAWFETAEKRLELKELKRYRIYRPMFYRTNVYMHGLRVAMLVMEMHERLADVLKFDCHKAVLMALIHDDPEIIMGDFQAGKKDKMSAEELRALEERGKEAAKQIAGFFPKRLGRYQYSALLDEVGAKESTEARIVDVCDKIDALGESFHEVFAGNERFVIPVITEDYGAIPTPPVYYQKFFWRLSDKHPMLRHLFHTRLTFLFFPEGDWRELVKSKKPHTVASLKSASGMPAYDFWKRTLLTRDPERQLKLLTTKVE